MNAMSYLEWSRLAGLYLDDISHADRYKKLAKKISPEGLHAIVVGEFLENNSPAVDVANWRTYFVYEMGSDLQQRVTITASSLETVGATRAAAAVREAKSNSPFEAFQNLDPNDPQAFLKAMSEIKGADLMGHLRANIAQNVPGIAAAAGMDPSQYAPKTPHAEYETHEQIEHLLEQFIQQHVAALQSDIDRHGDPRLSPGFTVEGQLSELDRKRRVESSHKEQRKDLRKISEFKTRVEEMEACARMVPPKPMKKSKEVRRDFRAIVRENRKRTPDELLPEMAEFLKEADAYMAARPAIFAGETIGDARTMARLAAIGDFEAGTSRGVTYVGWEDPKGLSLSWARTELKLSFPGKQQNLLDQLLAALERFKRQLPKLAEEWRAEILQTFHENFEEQMAEWELESYETGPDGKITDESILRNISFAELVLSIEDPTDPFISRRAYFSVEWEPEHGVELEWDEEADEDGTPAAGGFSLDKIEIVNSGPPLTPGDIAKFEATFGYELPEEYRQFLLLHNGGEPRPAHLIEQQSGARYHIDIKRFLSITGAEADKSETSLEAAIEELGGTHSTKNLLPIARLCYWNEPDEPFLLVLALSGKKQGTLAMIRPSLLNVLGGPTPSSESIARLLNSMTNEGKPFANSLQEIFSRKLQ